MYLPLPRFPVEFMSPVYFILWKAMNRISRSHRYSLPDSLFSAFLVGKKVKCLILCSLLCDQHIYILILVYIYILFQEEQEEQEDKTCLLKRHLLTSISCSTDFEKRDYSFISNCFRLSFSIIDQ